MPHINSLVYDFEGKNPDRVMIPHVVCSVVAHHSQKPRYNGIFPLDTGAWSDITFHNTLKSQIAHHSEAIVSEVSVAVAPLSAIKQKKQRYHAEHEPHVGELDGTRLLATQKLSAGFRMDGHTTLSLKAVKLAGRCAVVNPEEGDPVNIADYGGDTPVYSSDVRFADNLEGFEFQLSCDKERIDVLATTNFLRPDLLLKNKKIDEVKAGLAMATKKAICWDTGAAVSMFPRRQFEGAKLGEVVGKDLGVLDEISFLAKDKHTLLRCVNVPVRLGEAFIIGAPILNLFRMGFDPRGGRIGLSILTRAKWREERIEFDTELDRGTFISWKKPQPV